MESLSESCCLDALAGGPWVQKKKLMEWRENETLFTLPSSWVYSSRTSCSRSVTCGLERRRSGFGFCGAEEASGVGVGSVEEDMAWYSVSVVV